MTMRCFSMYKQLDYSARKKIERLAAKDFSVRQIADTLGTTTSTLYRELARCAIAPGRVDLTAYSAAQAQAHADSQATKKGARTKFEHAPGLAEYIADEIKARKSPKAIALAIKNGETPFTGVEISSITIYKAIHRGRVPGVTDADLPLGRRRPAPRKSRLSRRPAQQTG